MNKLIPIFLFFFIIISCVDARTEIHSAIKMTGNLSMGNHYIVDMGPTFTNDTLTINAKYYGARGDNSTNDTQALYDAITAANALATLPYQNVELMVPAGVYRVKPGALPVISCSINAPLAHFVAWDNTDAALLEIGSFYRGNIEICGLHGYGFNPTVGRVPTYGLENLKGTGLKISPINNFGNSFVKIGDIEGFDVGLHLDGVTHGGHIGTNDIDVTEILFCKYGILMQAGSLQNENNRIHVVYFAGNNNSIYMSHGDANPSPWLIGNIIDIDGMELHLYPGANGIITVGANTSQNVFNLNGFFYNAATNYVIWTANGAHDNCFNIPEYAHANIEANKRNKIYVGPNGVGKATEETDVGRSVIWGPYPPPAGYVGTYGDRYINNAPAAGGMASWCWTSGGWKVETTLAA